MTKPVPVDMHRSPAPPPTRGLLQPSFIVACLVLALAAFVVGPRVLARSPSDVKASLPLKRPLGQFDKRNLGPYKLPEQGGQVILNASVVDALGTAEYLSRYYFDTTIKEQTNPLRTVHVLVTYYSGGRDLVPHVPDQCYLGNGYQATKAADLDLGTPALGGKLPVRVLTFARSKLFGQDEPTVIYTFHCNGGFMATRNDVRFAIQSPGERYAYFCKIEISFGAADAQPANPRREDAVAAAAKFLDQFLPVLLRDHLPDWEAVHRDGPAPPAVPSPTGAGA